MGLLTRLDDKELDRRREIARSYRSGFGIFGRERQCVAQMRARLDREIMQQMRDGERTCRGGYGRR